MNLSKEDKLWISDTVTVWVFLLSLAGVGILWREQLGILSHVFVLAPLLLSGWSILVHAPQQDAKTLVESDAQKQPEKQPEHRHDGEKA